MSAHRPLIISRPRVLVSCVALALVVNMALGGCLAHQQSDAGSSGPTASNHLRGFLASHGGGSDESSTLETTVWVPKGRPWNYEYLSVTGANPLTIVLASGAKVTRSRGTSQEETLAVGLADLYGSLTDGGDRFVASRIALDSQGAQTLPGQGEPPPVPPATAEDSRFLVEGLAAVSNESSRLPSWLAVDQAGVLNDQGRSAPSRQYAVVDATTTVVAVDGRIVPLTAIQNRDRGPISVSALMSVRHGVVYATKIQLRE